MSQWPDYTILMAKFSAILNTEERFSQQYNVDGVIKSNLAKTSNRPSKGSSESTRTSWNCARNGHVISDCRSPPSKCSVCSGAHHTKMHDAVLKYNLKSASDSKPQKVLANQAEPSTTNQFSVLDDDSETNTAQNLISFMATVSAETDNDDTDSDSIPELCDSDSDDDDDDDDEKVIRLIVNSID